MMTSLKGLNSAFTPKWTQPDNYQPSVQVPEFTTDQLNPAWAHAFDAAGASEPGGVKMNPGSLGLNALQTFTPSTATTGPTSQTSATSLGAALEPYDQWSTRTKAGIASKPPTGAPHA